MRSPLSATFDFVRQLGAAGLVSTLLLSCSSTMDQPADTGTLTPTPVGACEPNAASTGNEIHVGAFCSPGGNQCSAFLEISGAAKICAADVDQEGGRFCIKIGCASHEACGARACCTGREGPGPKACVPLECVSDTEACPAIPGLNDGGPGSDAQASDGSDAGSDV